MDIAGKVFVVTGGGNGIGREVVLNLLRRGAKVAALDLSEEGLAGTANLANAGSELTTHAVNVTDVEAVEALPTEIVSAHGHVDGLVNVAGIIQPFVKVMDLDRAAMERVMNVNFWGVVNTCQAFLPELVKRPMAALVNVSSMGALAPVPGQAVYGASKAAVSLFTQALWAELAGTPVHVTVIYPGAIGTEISKNSGVSMPNMSEEDMAKAAAERKTTSPQDAAEVIVSAMEKGKFRATIGSDAAGLDKLSRFSPERATKTIANAMKDLLG